VGTKRTQYVAVDDVGQQFQKRHFDSRVGWHETTISRDRSRRAHHQSHSVGSLTAGAHTRSSSQREPNTFTREASSGNSRLHNRHPNQHSGPVLAQCWLTTFQNSCPQPPPTALFLHDVTVIGIAIRDRLTLPAVAVYQRRKPQQRATMSAA